MRSHGSETEGVEQARSRAGGRRAVVVVHDEPVVLNLFRVVLTQHGLAAEGASSVDAARRIVAGGEPAAVIADLHLPDGQGTDLLAEVRQKYGPKLPLAIITTDYLAEASVRAAGDEMDAFVRVGLMRLADINHLIGQMVDTMELNRTSS